MPLRSSSWTLQPTSECSLPIHRPLQWLLAHVHQLAFALRWPDLELAQLWQQLECSCYCYLGEAIASLEDPARYFVDPAALLPSSFECFPAYPFELEFPIPFD
jgi:hypothetical protein